MATRPRKYPPKKPLEPIIRKRKGKESRFVVTEAILKETAILAGHGLTNGQIFNYYGIDKHGFYTALQEYPELAIAIAQGKSKAISFVAGKLMEKIRDGNLTAIIFYLRTQARWSEHSSIMINEPGENSPALKIEVTDPVEAARIYQRIMMES